MTINAKLLPTMNEYIQKTIIISFYDNIDHETLTIIPAYLGFTKLKLEAVLN